MDITHLLSLMNEYEASDLYLTEGSVPMFRVDGHVRPYGKDALDAEKVKELLYSIMTERQILDFETHNEVNLALEYKTIGRYRLNVYRQRTAVAGVFRKIKERIPTIDDLELPAILKEIAMTKRGLALIVGATGSGKSTTLASMINHRNESNSGHIITIEDPIEYIYEHKKCIVSQREVGLDTESFEIAIKNALRQAPDVVLIGEIRDRKTMESAITFAETGHLCFATLHSNNSYQAFERILNFFPGDMHKQILLQLSMNLRSIISQRLIPRAKAGRVAAMEVLLDSPRIKDLIFKGEIGNLKEAIEKSNHLGMQSFDQSLFELYKAGKISLENAIAFADSANNVRLRIKLDKDAGIFDENKVGRKSSSINKVELG